LNFVDDFAYQCNAAQAFLKIFASEDSPPIAFLGKQTIWSRIHFRLFLNTRQKTHIDCA